MTDTLDWFRKNWRRALVLLLPICVTYGAILTLEGVAVSWIDRWLPVETFEEATRFAVFVTAVATWLQLCLVGLAVYLILQHVGHPAPGRSAFAVAWLVGSIAVTVTILAVDLGQHQLQYGGQSFSGDAVRMILLTLIYVKILLVYPGARLLLGAAYAGENHDQRGIWPGVRAAWGATSLASSIGLFLLLLALKLTIETVVVTMLSYLPFVAPFWFVPDELSRVRYFAGQGTRIVAESLGVVLYAMFFVTVRRTG